MTHSAMPNPREYRFAVRRILAAASVLVLLGAPSVGGAQTFRTDDPVIRQMWQVGMESSWTESLAQVLLDSIGPRLAGSPELVAAQDWLVDLYGSWGVNARKERYGEWNGWRQGTLHVDMVAPRVQTL